MTSPQDPTPSSSENESSADDPEWIKGVVAKALLHATAGDQDAETSAIGSPIEPTPAVRATAAWPTMSASIPEMAPLADLPNPVPLNTAIAKATPPIEAPPAAQQSTQLPEPKPLIISPAVENRTALTTPNLSPETPTIPTQLAATPAVTSPVTAPATEPVAAPSTPPATERPPRMTSFAPTPLEEEVVDSIAEREPIERPQPSAALATVQDAAANNATVNNGTVLTVNPPERLPSVASDMGPLRDAIDLDDDVMVETDATTEGYRSSDLRTILEWLAVIVAALVVALLIKAFVLQAFWIPSESMETTVNEGDRILVNKVSYNLHEVRRGDLVVFEKLEGTPGDTKDLIKRAIALPGETIEVRADGRIWIWGPGETPEDAKLLEEPYLDPQNAILAVPSSSDPSNQTIWDDRCVNQENPGRCTLDENSFFMMGDNRFRSLDSRSFGPVPAENIVGRAFLRIWPPGDISTL